MNVAGLDISFQILDFRIRFSHFVHLDLQVLVDTVHQDFVSISVDPDDVIHASECTVGLFSDIHVLILSYLSEDLGAHSIHGLTSGDLRRYFKFFNKCQFTYILYFPDSLPEPPVFHCSSEQASSLYFSPD